MSAPPIAPENIPLNNSIILDTARDRLWEIYERELHPRDVKDILAGGLNGYSQQWEALYKAMFDSWPRLQKNLGTLKRATRNAPWKVKPFTEQDEDPTPDSIAHAKAASRMLWKCKPDIKRAEIAFNGLLEGLVTQYFTGIGVHEIDWHHNGTEWLPRAYKEIPARYYGYPSNCEGPDRLMLRPDGTGHSSDADFPDHRFIIAINGGHPGHPATSAPLRCLTAYWLAAVFGWKWFMQFAQLFGVPFRWATYASTPDKPAVEKMMQSIGSAGWGAGPAGTTVTLAESSKSGAGLPQAEIVRIADEQCDIFMLGQTLTSSVGSSGSRALGEVHESTLDSVIRGICDFAGEIITTQLIPAWTYWNTGTIPDQLPEFYPEWPQPRDEKSLAERDKLLGILDGTTPVSKAWFYERHNIPAPTAEDDLFIPPPSNSNDQQEPNPLAATFSASLLESYSPSQPRAAKGNPDGGKWTKGSGSSGGGGGGKAPSPKAHKSSSKAKHQARADDLIRDIGLKDAKTVVKGHGFSFTAFSKDGKYSLGGEVVDDRMRIYGMEPVGETASFTGRSLGTDLLHRVVTSAEKAGINRIVTTGAKDGPYNYTGYRTWPDLGFEMTAKEQKSFMAPPEIRKLAGDPPSLIRLMETKAGRDWWKQDGKDVELEFDLTPGSPSRQRLDYKRNRMGRRSTSASHAANGPALSEWEMNERELELLEEMYFSDEVYPSAI